MMVRDATADLGDRVAVTEIYAHSKDAMRRHGESFDVVYVDGEPWRPDGPPTTKEEFRQALLDRYAEKNAG